MVGDSTLSGSMAPNNFEKEWKRWNRFFTIYNDAGPEVGQTPKETVWKKNKSALYYYPSTNKKYETPIFIVYSLFNKPFILDLGPGSSIIEGMVNQGYDVYLLDWGVPGYEDKDISINDYIVDYLQRAVKRTLRHSGAEEITMIGYCLGGTIAAMYAAIAEEPIQNLIVATVPIDFSVVAGPDKWIEGAKNGEINIDKFIDVYGLIPPPYVEAMFRAISSPIYFTPYVSLLEKAYDENYVEKWARMDKWTKGHIPFTGAGFRQLYNDFMKENKLIKGEIFIRGKKVDLNNIDANLLVIISKNDHLIPKEQSLPLMELVSSKDKECQFVEAGHVSLALSRKFPLLLGEWLKDRSKEIEFSK